MERDEIWLAAYVYGFMFFIGLIAPYCEKKGWLDMKIAEFFKSKGLSIHWVLKPEIHEKPGEFKRIPRVVFRPSEMRPKRKEKPEGIKTLPESGPPNRMGSTDTSASSHAKPPLKATHTFRGINSPVQEEPSRS